MAHVILLSKDLIFTSQIAGAATDAGHDYRTCSSARRVEEIGSESAIDLLLVDLRTDLQALAGCLSSLKGKNQVGRVVAFGPHVEVELLESAQQAGCDEVMTRGQFVGILDELLKF